MYYHENKVFIMAVWSSLAFPSNHIRQGLYLAIISPGIHQLLTQLNLLLHVVPGFKLLNCSFVSLVKQIQKVDKDDRGAHGLQQMPSWHYLAITNHAAVQTIWIVCHILSLILSLRRGSARVILKRLVSLTFVIQLKAQSESAEPSPWGDLLQNTPGSF